MVTSIAVFPGGGFRELGSLRQSANSLNTSTGTKMKFCGPRPLIGPGTINDKMLHEPRSGLTVRYLGDSEKCKGVTRPHFTSPV